MGLCLTLYYITCSLTDRLCQDTGGRLTEELNVQLIKLNEYVFASLCRPILPS